MGKSAGRGGAGGGESEEEEGEEEEEIVVEGSGPWPCDWSVYRSASFRSGAPFTWLQTSLEGREAPLRVRTALASSALAAAALPGMAGRRGEEVGAGATIAFVRCLQFYAYPPSLLPQGVLAATAGVGEELWTSVSRELREWERAKAAAAARDAADHALHVERAGMAALGGGKGKGTGVDVARQLRAGADRKAGERISRLGGVMAGGAWEGGEGAPAVPSLSAEAKGSLGVRGSSRGRAGSAGPPTLEGKASASAHAAALSTPAPSPLFISPLPLPLWLPGVATAGSLLTGSGVGAAPAQLVISAAPPGGVRPLPFLPLPFFTFGGVKASKAKVTRSRGILDAVRAEEREARRARAKEAAREERGAVRRAAREEGEPKPSKPRVASKEEEAGAKMRRKEAPLPPAAPAPPPLVRGLPHDAYARIRARCEGSTADGVAAWVDRVCRFQEALASAYTLLVHPSRPLPFFLLRFGHDDRTGNVILFARAQALLQRTGADAKADPPEADVPVAILVRSTRTLRLRLALAGVPATSPLDPSLLEDDLGDADPDTLAALREMDRAAGNGGGAGVMQVSAASMGVQALALQIRAVLGRGAAKAEEEEQEEGEEVEEMDEGEEGGKAEGEERAGKAGAAASAPAPRARVSLLRGTADSATSLLLVTGSAAVARLSELLMESAGPGGQASMGSVLVSAAAGAEESSVVPKRVAVPLPDFALLGAGTGAGAGAGSIARVGRLHDVPQLCSPLGVVPFRHAALCELGATLRQSTEAVPGGEEGAAPRLTTLWDLDVTGPLLPGTLPRLAALLALMQAREGGAGPLLRVRAEAHKATGMLSRPETLDTVAVAVAEAAVARNPAVPELALAERLLSSAAWLPLGAMDARGGRGKREDRAVAALLAALPTAGSVDEAAGGAPGGAVGDRSGLSRLEFVLDA